MAGRVGTELAVPIEASTASSTRMASCCSCRLLSAAAALSMSGAAVIWQAVDSGAFATLRVHDTLSATPSLRAWLFVFYVGPFFIVIFLTPR